VPTAVQTRSARFLSDKHNRLALSSTTISSNGELLPGIEAIDRINPDLLEKLEEVRKVPYFRLYSVDMLGSCEYMPQELFECYSQTCEVYPVEDDKVPESLRVADLEDHDFELDGWARWDMPSEDYYDTEEFPEGYTAYDGSEVWRFIHEKICFEEFTYDSDSWKADFNKAVSGLHSMISAQVILGIQEKINAGEEFTDEEMQWSNPAQEFQRRLSPQGETPLAIENLYFCFMLLLSAVSKASNRLLVDCQAGRVDQAACASVSAILSSPLLNDPSVGVASKKLHDHATKDSDSVGALWEARLRIRDLYRVMNCVQCNKCRFHGKISAMGLSTALQILVGRTGEGGDLNRIHRVELAALMSTLYKFSRTISYCQQMSK